ncbi:DeoR/GlpR transcriptional regulator [Halalkalibacterium halodurans]|jgi:DeoR/GlpR family transcriptional regulator of sugar metabolism|nr:DeoR/GlpR transcriptional regulator [Halalkalibacterium halodurans]TPE70301.1 DeoR/GlpR transcriptional regulator [Halalkalibacterium halodurans]
MNLYQDERLPLILEELKKHQRITVEQICARFGVSRDTARRDLVKLEEQKVIIRTRGGAILPSAHQEVKGYHQRLETVSKEKKQIGEKAASFIHEGDRLILDTSTTVQALADFFPNVRCTIVTNSINLADLLSAKKHADIQLLGGKLEKKHRYLYGASVIERLRSYYVDKLFLGVVGISEHGLTIAHEEDGMVKRTMLQQAKQKIVLADHSKIGVTDYFKLADLSDIDVLITDRSPPYSFHQLLQQHGVELVITGEETEE